MTRDETLILALSYWPTGATNSGWMADGSYNGGVFDPSLLREAAQTAERGKFDYIFLGNTEYSDPSSPASVVRRAFQINGFSASSFLAESTQNIGLIASVNSSYYHPYFVAHESASIDHLSQGRFGLNIVTGAPSTMAAGNFGGGSQLESAEKYRRAKEFVEVVNLLQDSWEDDWLVDDRSRGVFFDPSKAHEIDYVGEHFQVRGPLNAPRPPQGRVPLLHAGTSEQSFDFGSEFADIRFSPFYSREWNQEYSTDKKERAIKFGRSPKDHLIVCGTVFYPAETLSAARAMFRSVEEAVVEKFGPEHIAKQFNIRPGAATPHARVLDVLRIESGQREAHQNVGSNLSSTPLDDKFSFQDGHYLVENAIEAYGTEDITFLDLFRFTINKPRFPVVVGGPKEIADWIEDGYGSEAFDGVKFFPPFMRTPLHKFVDHIVPELQRRGLTKTQYSGNTLRDNLGLKRPNRVHA